MEIIKTGLCLYQKSDLDHKSFVCGNEYNYKITATNEYCVYNEYGEFYWFNKSEFHLYFMTY